MRMRVDTFYSRCIQKDVRYDSMKSNKYVAIMEELVHVESRTNFSLSVGNNWCRNRKGGAAGRRAIEGYSGVELQAPRLRSTANRRVELEVQGPPKDPPPAGSVSESPV